MSISGAVLKSDFLKIIQTQPNELPFEVSSDGLEVLKYRSNTSRQSLEITSITSTTTTTTNPNDRKVSIQAQDGFIYLTTKRLVFITATQGDIQSFVIDLNLAPLLQLSHKIKAPWIGSNYWEFMFHSSSQNNNIATNGLPKNQYFIGKIKFHDGGLFEFCDILNKTLNDAVNNRDIDDTLPAYNEVQ
ncbi:conserved hypothetical protein [Candida dubliniensis CD36]|uniref:Uncharacterized protein n=1 Tax=Candida dubliniensis (strain CD36 / ATCC MYA-646 / CBS 7987 / NCPF 3949 / NRRL Y-17841) TaxID=573826 RepID=B9WAP9_CANDC|nr:conserved hypothetical protein [Candida dubliniensis CD36]CAX43469.1 conserved hypothetical protein [Candida dubliniensis CD36]